MNQHDIDIVRYRQSNARESLDAGKLLAANASWRGCVNRLYYACFYAVTALLKTQGLSSSKHTGVRSLFNRNYVKLGLVSADAGELYNTLFDERQDSDYADLVNPEAEKVSLWLTQTQPFLDEIDALIQQAFDAQEDESS